MGTHENRPPRRARRREWTLAGLDRRRVYQLYFDDDETRWAILELPHTPDNSGGWHRI
jgi:hypothetical protein